MTMTFNLVLVCVILLAGSDLHVCSENKTRVENRYQGYFYWLAYYSDYSPVPEHHLHQSVHSLQIPLQLEISTDSNSSRCIPSNAPYCYPKSSVLPTLGNGACPDGGQNRKCEEVRCTHEEKDRPIEEYSFSLRFVEPDNITVPIPIGQHCGMRVAENELAFEDRVSAADQSPCSFEQPVIVLASSDSSSNYTIFFEVQSDGANMEDEEITVFNISGYSVEKELITSATLNAGTTEVHLSADNLHSRKFKDLTKVDGVFALVVNGVNVAMFHNGDLFEIVQTLDISQDREVKEVLVGFGSENFRGLVSNIEGYSIAFSTNEIYAKFTSQSLASHVLEPQCKCPREYGDSFNLLARTDHSHVPDNLCFSIFTNSPKLSTTRYSGNSQGKWAIFTQEGWMSDFTNQTIIRINFSQPMLTYALSGEFPVHGSIIKMPIALEASLRRHNDQLTQVYITNNCTAYYRMQRSSLPLFSSYNELFEYYQLTTSTTTSADELVKRKRRSAPTIPVRCYHWEDVIFVADRGRITKWFLPFMMPDDAAMHLSDVFTGDVYLKLIGHQNGNGQSQNWYSIMNFQLHTRPHCDGLDFTLVKSPTTLPKYYEFHKTGAKGYHCKCIDDFKGDECESCKPIIGEHRYMKRPGVCATCRCSELALSPQCNEFTGQCNCGENIDLKLAGRRCMWYIRDIYPLYGPIAGGTTVTIKGEYLAHPGIKFEVHTINQYLTTRFSETGQTILFDVPDYEENESHLDIEIRADSNFEIGSRHPIYTFEYRSNPVITNINPKKAILSGGTNLSVTGEFLDSVAVPKLLVYVRRNSKLVKVVDTNCDVIEASMMLCPMENLNSDGQLMLDHFTSNGYVESLINGFENLTFSLGFLFDGHTRYKDMNQLFEPGLKSMGHINIHADPKVQSFRQTTGSPILEYEPSTSNEITFEGRNLDAVLSIKNYKVEIGIDGRCNITSINSNQLTCLPTQTVPGIDPDDFDTYNGKSLPYVKVIAGPLMFKIGYIYYKGGFWTDNIPGRAGVISFIVVVAVAVVCAVGFGLVRQYKTWKHTSTTDVTEMEAQTGAFAAYDNGTFLENFALDPEMEMALKKCRIPVECVKLGIHVGKGQFGLVCKGRLQTPDGELKTVAIKTLKVIGEAVDIFHTYVASAPFNKKCCFARDNSPSKQTIENFLREATMMADFHHPNVLSLIGVAVEKGEQPLVVLPYMENGDLCSFIKREDTDLSLGDLLHFGLQIASGMKYLRTKRFVHRDLASQNCMVSGSLVIKVADFGLSRDIYQQDYYMITDTNIPLPCKWMALESLLEGRFSSMSDVWAFGVTMWELLTRGSSPYPGVANCNVKSHLKAGHRLDKPASCPSVVYQMMVQCWDECPERRPTFSDIASLMDRVLRGEENNDEEYIRHATAHIYDDSLCGLGVYELNEYHRAYEYV